MISGRTVASRRVLARAATGLIGVQAGLRLLPRTRGRVGPAEISAAVSLGRSGGVRVDVPPLGSALLPTHGGPLQVDAHAVSVDPEAAQALVGADRYAAGTGIPADARRFGVTLAARTAAAGLAGAAGLAALALRRPRDVATATAVAAAALAAAGARAASTLDGDAWRDPQLDGLLTRAPLLLGDLRTAPERIGVYRDQLAELLETATAVYRRVATLPEPPPHDAVRLLHISDIHLSPVAFGLAAAAAEQYGVDAVIDTGDLVDWGTPAENGFAAQIAALKVPYVYVKGNHDSDGIAAAVARQPNATVLTAGDAPVEIAGLRFVGMADPRFTPDKTTGDDHAPHRVSEAATAFAATLSEREGTADIALVHSPAAARPLAGLVPLVLAGDIHKRRVRHEGGTIVLVQGSTGGSGLRGVQQDPPTPCMLSVLYLDRGTRRLVAVDEITLGGLGQTEIRVQRRSVDDLVDEG